MRKIWAAAGLAALALAVSACGSSSSSSSATSTPAAGASSPAASVPASSASANTVLSTTINGTQVLTNSKGLTLYWFVPDTSTKFELHRILRDLLAAGDGPGDRRVRRHRHAGHHYQVGRLDAGHV